MRGYLFPNVVSKTFWNGFVPSSSSQQNWINMPKRRSNLFNKFDVGDTVMAKWPGSNNYYNGKVKDFNDIEYLVVFDDPENSEYPVKYKDVTLPFRTRNRSSSRVRSPSRRSPGRSPGRSPSRGRPPKTPRNNEDKLNSTNEKESIVRSRVQVTPTRQSSRIADKISQETTIIKETNEIKVNDVLKLNSNSSPTKKEKGVCPLNGCCVNVMNGVRLVLPTLKTLPMLIFLLAGPLVFNQICTKKKCSITQMPVFHRDPKFYFDVRAIAMVTGFLGVQLLLSFLPIGKVVTPGNGAKMRMNGYIGLMVNLIAIPAMLHLKVDVLMVYLLYRQLLATVTILGLVLSLILYIKGTWFGAGKANSNPDGNTAHPIPDLVEGREVSPAFGSLDIKFFLFRCAIFSMILFNLIVIMKDIQSRNGVYSPTVIIAASLQIIYGLDLVWFEEGYFTTWEYKVQGTGLLICVGYLTMAFYTLVLSRFVMNHGVELEWYYLAGIVCLNLLGYIILRSANSQKHAFRSNPSDPALAHLESMPTGCGSRLLVSGWWGIVRHPNYIGDILIQISWGLICGFKFALPWIIVGITCLYLVARVFIVESTCKAKYRLAWNSYTSRIKYRLIPKIF